MYIVFYDDTCHFCQNCVAAIKKRDRHHRFCFSSLKAELATQHGITKANELVLYDHGALYFGGKAVFRILWRLGGIYTFLGILSFLPGWLFVPYYRYVAKRCRRCDKKS